MKFNLIFNMNNEGNMNFFPLLNLTVSWRQDMCSDVTCPAEGAANIVEVEDNDVFEHYTAAVAICLGVWNWTHNPTVLYDNQTTYDISSEWS